MVIGIVQLELAIEWAMSIKDKRRVVKRLKDRLRNRFNVSVAEVGDNELWRSAVIGVAAVGNDAKFLQSVCQKIVNFVEEYGDAELSDYSIEIL